MVQVIVQHKVKDYDRWLPLFKEHDATRREYGCEGATVQRILADPNSVVLVLRWRTAAGFQDFMTKSDVKQVMAKAGVVSEPIITLMTDAQA